VPAGQVEFPILVFQSSVWTKWCASKKEVRLPSAKLLVAKQNNSKKKKSLLTKTKWVLIANSQN